MADITGQGSRVVAWLRRRSGLAVLWWALAEGSASGLEAAPALVSFDIPVATAVAIACVPISAGGQIARWEGWLFIGYYVAYVAYVAYLVFAATAHDALPAFSNVMLGFVLPLTAATLLALWLGKRAASALNRDKAVDS